MFAVVYVVTVDLGGPNDVGEEERHHRSQEEERDGEEEKSNRGKYGKWIFNKIKWGKKRKEIKRRTIGIV